MSDKARGEYRGRYLWSKKKRQNLLRNLYRRKKNFIYLFMMWSWSKMVCQRYVEVCQRSIVLLKHFTKHCANTKHCTKLNTILNSNGHRSSTPRWTTIPSPRTSCRRRGFGRPCWWRRQTPPNSETPFRITPRQHILKSLLYIVTLSSKYTWTLI